MRCPNLRGAHLKAVATTAPASSRTPAIRASTFVEGEYPFLRKIGAPFGVFHNLFDPLSLGLGSRSPQQHRHPVLMVEWGLAVHLLVQI